MNLKTGVSRKQSTPNFRKCLFLGKFDVLCFLETPVLRFALLPYYRQNLGFCFFRPLRKWVNEKKEQMNSFFFNDPIINLRAKPILPEERYKDEYARKLRYEEEAEKFKQMHINPLRANKSDEDALKSILGMKGEYHICWPRSVTPPVSLHAQYLKEYKFNLFPFRGQNNAQSSDMTKHISHLIGH